MASGHEYRARRPNTWLLRPLLQSEDSSCQPGAVHTWPEAAVSAALAPPLGDKQISGGGPVKDDANDPRRTFKLFSRYPSRGVSAGCELAPNDVDVTAQIIQLVREGQWKADMADSLLNALDICSAMSLYHCLQQKLDNFWMKIAAYQHFRSVSNQWHVIGWNVPVKIDNPLRQYQPSELWEHAG